jgi:glycosyltransferase involved in cell wall biosynthesis
MRLLLTATNDIGNGTTQRMLFVAKALSETGTEVAVALPRSMRSSEFLRTYCPKVSETAFAPCSVLQEIWNKYRIARRFEPDAIIHFCVGARFLMPFRGPLKAAIIYDWDEWMSRHMAKNAAVRAKNRMAEAVSLFTGDGWIAASEFLYHRIGSQKGIGRVFYLPNGYDDVVDVSMAEGRPATCFESGCTNFIYIGSVDMEYQIWELIHLAQHVKTTGCRWKIHVVGTGRDMERFRNEIISKGLDKCFIMHGWMPVDQVGRYLRAAHIAVFPFPPTIQNIARCPLKIYQYVAAQKPVVTNCVGEVAKALGDSGWYYDAGNAGSLIRKCEEAVASLGGRQSRDGSSVGQNMSWKHRVEGIEKWLGGLKRQGI